MPEPRSIFGLEVGVGTGKKQVLRFAQDDKRGRVRA
jgi:hypothetical protein